LRTLKRPPFAPRDILKHTYELYWEEEGVYTIYIDEKLVSHGLIIDDFEDGSKP
jgi:hypothetical protein